MSWYLSDFPRLKSERVGLETFALGVNWFTALGWRMDERMRLVLDGEIAVGDRIFPIFLRYPEMFPFSPPSVFPRGDKSRWSSHQFGPGGELCLEHGPDNWMPEMTGVQMIESAHQLLLLENPSEGAPTVVASRHVETLGQKLRNRLHALTGDARACRFFRVCSARHDDHRQSGGVLSRYRLDLRLKRDHRAR